MPWLGLQGLTQVLWSVCHNAIGSGRAVQKARQDFKNGPVWLDLPWSSPPGLGAGALRALVSPSQSPKLFRDLHHRQSCSGRSHASVTI